MKQSFRHRITLFLLGTIALTIIMCWFLNLTFLRTYYAHTKLSLMREVHSAVNDYILANNLQDYVIEHLYIKNELVSKEASEINSKYNWTVEGI